MRMPYGVLAAALVLLACAVPRAHAGASCAHGTVYADRNANGRMDAGERRIAGVKVSDGRQLAITDAMGAYRLDLSGAARIFVIKPAGYQPARRGDGLPDLWRDLAGEASPPPAAPSAVVRCPDFALLPEPVPSPRPAPLDVLVFADPQPKSLTDVGYYRRDIIEPLQRDVARLGVAAGPLDGASTGDARVGRLGLSLGDITHDDPSLYPALVAATTSLGVPWLHVPGNHDLDFAATGDEDSLHSYQRQFGPDTHAWEEPQATFVLLDDVVYQPGQQPSYVGGLREDQFTFLARYLPTVPKDRLLVVAAHIPFFDAAPGRETFRDADRTRLFAMLAPFPHVLLLTGHSHAQRHVHHDASSGWHGASPLHEYNVGAACGAFWSGVKDAQGIPDTTMADGTPNGHARLRVSQGGAYALSWHPARLPATDPALSSAMRVSAPKVLRRGAWPAFAVQANVFMGQDDTRVEYRIDDGAWQPMRRASAPDPWLLAQNVLDDGAPGLRGYDRAPPADPSPHLWRGTLPTDLGAGSHSVEVRVFDRWQGEQRASVEYRLVDAAE